MKKNDSQPISREKQLLLDDLERNYWRMMGKRVLKDWRLYLMILPLVLVFLFWRYFPMQDLMKAFKIYEAGNPNVGEWDYTGLTNFTNLFSSSNYNWFWPAFRNTFVLSFYGLLFGFPIPILLALFFSEIKSNGVRSVIQIFTYLPKFVSTVVITSIVSLLLSGSTPDNPESVGVLAKLFAGLGGEGSQLASDATRAGGLLAIPKYFRSIYQVTGIWTDAGYGSIVYFAAIIGISPTSYEAARIDGASKMAQIKYVVLPGILSTIIIMLITRLGHLMTLGFEKVLLLQSTTDTGKETSEIISTKVINFKGTENEPVGTAADMLNSLISMLLVIGANMISKRAANTSLY